MILGFINSAPYNEEGQWKDLIRFTFKKDKLVRNTKAELKVTVLRLVAKI